MNRAIRESWGQSFRLPAKFDSEDIEFKFAAHYRIRFALMRRVSGALGVSIWTAHVLLELTLRDLDPAVFGPAAGTLLALRIGTSAVIAAAALLSLSGRMEVREGYAELLIFVSAGVTLGSSLAMKIIAPAPYDYLYYFDGLMVCMLFFFGMFRLRARNVGALLVVNGACYVASLWLQPQALVNGLISLILLVTVSVIGYAISVQLEQSERRSFGAQHELSLANGALRSRNLDVEELNVRLAESMAESLRRSQALIRAEEQLREEAERRSRDKSRFLALSVHDLKQPVQAISSALYTARYARMQDDEPRLNESLALANAAAAAMRSQLTAILDISRLESGVIKAEVTSVSLQAAAASAVEQQAGVAREQGVSLRITCDPLAALNVRSDVGFLERILTNLISNGIKYRHPDGCRVCEVVLALDAGPAGARVSVTDNGIGIDPQYIENGAIFDPFFRAGEASHLCEGVGMGLSIVRAMVAVLPGHGISVQSVPHLGTTFMLDLPLCCAADTAPVPPWVGDMRDAGLDALAGAYILLVEDDPLVNRSIASVLELHGALCETYGSYEAFAEGSVTLERLPDLLLTDYRLPRDRTAAHVIRQARGLFDSLPVLVVSGELGDLDGLSSLAAISVMRKPLNPDDLLGRVGRMLRRQELDA